MAGKHRHVGGMSSAMANLKKIDAEIATDRAPAPRCPGKDAALRKYERFMDRRLDDGITLDEAQRLRAEGKNVQEARWLGQARSLARIAAPAQLKEFVAETGHLTWPASFGSSPWERAWAVAAALGYVPGVARVEDRDPGLPYHAHDVATAAAYRGARRAVEAELSAMAPTQSAPADRAIPTFYIYPTKEGEVGGQILDQGKSVWGVAGCLDRNEVIDAATEAGYQGLRITDVPHMEDVLEVERLREEEEVLTGTAAHGDRDEEQDQGR